jgi:antitoxin component of MazEF toxin-antitoxin module
MNGETTKYYQYKSSTSASVTIPKAIAKALNWNHKDKIKVVIKTLEGNTGIFLFKPDKEEENKE